MKFIPHMCNYNLEMIHVLDRFTIYSRWLEQLERLCSDDNPHDYPYYWPVHIGSEAHTTDQLILDSKSKQDKLKVTN